MLGLSQQEDMEEHHAEEEELHQHSCSVGLVAEEAKMVDIRRSLLGVAHCSHHRVDRRTQAVEAGTLMLLVMIHNPDEL
jgi:hypothetical protein